MTDIQPRGSRTPLIALCEDVTPSRCTIIALGRDAIERGDDGERGEWMRVPADASVGTRAWHLGRASASDVDAAR